MRARTEKLTDIPADMLEEIVKQFEDDGSKSIVATRQPDGRWTVVAVIPVDPEAK